MNSQTELLIQSLDRRAVEEKIEEALAAANDSTALSNLLFTPDGLFNQIAHNEQERRALSQTPLFRRAMARVSELRRAEVQAILRGEKQVPPGPGIRIPEGAASRAKG
jgi:hypothetical protein